MKKRILLVIGLFTLIVIVFFVSKKYNLNPTCKVGQKIDSFNDVPVYFNGGVENVEGRELTKDGYNLGLKYQCVEFVKRYYYKELNHKMLDSYGHAKDFFISSLKDGQLNKQRNLNQFTNPSKTKPIVNDLVIYSGTILNKYGHVSIISAVSENEIEIIQQNSGAFGKTREKYDLIMKDGKWLIKHDRILGWLRK